MLDGVYRLSTDGEPVFVEVPAPTHEALQTVLHKIITRTMKLLTRRGVLIEEQGQTYLANNDGDSDEARVLRPEDAEARTFTVLRECVLSLFAGSFSCAAPRRVSARLPSNFLLRAQKKAIKEEGLNTI